jgi:hypothetical protein
MYKKVDMIPPVFEIKKTLEAKDVVFQMALWSCCVLQGLNSRRKEQSMPDSQRSTLETSFTLSHNYRKPDLKHHCSRKYASLAYPSYESMK